MIVNRNWDKSEKVLDSEFKLRSIHGDVPLGAENKHLAEHLNNIISEVEYLMSKTESQDMAIPDNIISFRSGGFDINMDNMPVDKKFRFRFEGSRYVIWKNTDDELVVKEVE